MILYVIFHLNNKNILFFLKIVLKNEKLYAHKMGETINRCSSKLFPLSFHRRFRGRKVKKNSLKQVKVPLY